MDKKKLNIAPNIEQSFAIMKLIYEIKDEKIIGIFHPYFVKNNRKNFKMIINNKIYELSSKYQITNQKMKKLKVKLLFINNKKKDLSFMFAKCKSLKKFKIISKAEKILIEENKSEEEDKLRDKEISEKSEISENIEISEEGDISDDSEILKESDISEEEEEDKTILSKSIYADYFRDSNKKLNETIKKPDIINIFSEIINI